MAVIKRKSNISSTIKTKLVDKTPVKPILKKINNKNSFLEPPKKRVRRTKEQLKENYVDPIEMERLIGVYYQTGYLSNDLADMVQKIATRLGYAQNFINYSFKTEMIGDAVIKMITALTRKRFKCDNGYNPFSYFTKVAYRAFQNRIKKEKKEHDTLHRYQEEVFSLLTENNQIPARKNTKNSTEEDGYDIEKELLNDDYE